MVRRCSHSTISSSSTNHARLNQISPSMSSTSSTPILTPASTSASSNSTARLTPSSSPSTRYGGSPDPDTPLPSIEGDTSRTNSRQSTPNTTSYASSISTLVDSTRQTPFEDNVAQTIVDLRDLNLASTPRPGRPSSQRSTSTPSIQVIPSTESESVGQAPARRTESLISGVSALRIESPQARTPEASGPGESRSPSPAHRRRSGSAVARVRHRVEDEEPPQALFHLPEVQQALADARTLTSRMAGVLSSSNLHQENGSRVESLHQQASNLSDFRLPSSRVVGLVGDSGVGKSSLINSLLDQADLARASSSGSACTCAVTEYLFHDRDDFIVQVDYFPLDELKKQIEELLRAYRDYQLLPANSSNRNQDAEDDTDRRRVQRKADLAIETFRASFGERLQQTPNLLNTTDFEQAVETMFAWTSELLPRQRGNEVFNTAAECSARLRELTSESNNALPNRASRTCWPFIQKLRVHLRAYILSKGLIITDLPGLRDLNSARRNITERYVRNCHQIFVVARIDRAITDESIKEIFDLASRADLSKIDVVCTRSEDVQRTEARHDYPSERATIEGMQEAIADTERQINSYKEDMDDDEEDHQDPPSGDDVRRLMALQQGLRRAERTKEAQELEFQSYIVRLRNDKVSGRLQDQYRNNPNADTMRIFCISNKIYWDKRDVPARYALPYLNLSGILELRQYCIGIVAESHFRATQEFIKDEIPAFLGSVKLWVEAGSGNASAEKKQKMLDTVAAIQLELDEWNPASYKAFCSNYGDHNTAKMGYHCWNADAMDGMELDMEDSWDSFEDDLGTHLKQINDLITKSFATVIKAALSVDANSRGTAGNRTSAMRTLAKTLRHREELVLYGIEKACETFYSGLLSLKTDAFSSIRTAFIGKLMENTYHAANMEYGRDSDRRRKNLITGRFGSVSLFNDYRRECQIKFRDIAGVLQEDIAEVIDQQVELIEADLQILKDGNAVLESEKDPAFRRRVESEIEGVAEELERIGGALEVAP